MVISVFLLMYLVTSFMMMYHNVFEVVRTESAESLDVVTEEISEANWKQFLKKNRISGRLQRERFGNDGHLIREYGSPGSHTRITLDSTDQIVTIAKTRLNLWGEIIGLHRLRGYQGSLKYILYAIMIDLVGVSLILFSITGVFLWMKLLRKDKIAWTIFIAGIIYVLVVFIYLMRH
jgi:hypothetical protein